MKNVTILRQLEAARRESERELNQIKIAISALGGHNRKGRYISPAGREAISRAQKARWAKIRKAA